MESKKIENKSYSGRLYEAEIRGFKKERYGSNETKLSLGIVTPDIIESLCGHLCATYEMLDGHMPDLSVETGLDGAKLEFEAASHESKWDEITIDITCVGIMYDEHDVLSAGCDFGSNPDRLFKLAGV